MKKTYIKPEIRIIELPKNNFIATSGPTQLHASGDVEGDEGGGGGPGVFDDIWDGRF